jgi:hypothetical protein
MRSRLLPHRAYRAVANLVGVGRATGVASRLLSTEIKGVTAQERLSRRPFGSPRACWLIVSVLCELVFLLAGGMAPSVAGAASFGSEGEGAGQFQGPYGVALDRATGYVYVPDRRNYRVDEFDGSGSFLAAWGWSVDEANPVNELQTCTTYCRGGSYGYGAGQASDEGFQGVAVDNDSLSSSYQDVYVVDWDNYRVQKFDASGKFLLMFGGGVNETSGGDVCAAGEKCIRGKEGTADGQFEWAYEPDGTIAVGPEGRVYVGDRARIEVFEPSGVWRENISLAGLSATGKVTAIAVNSAGDMFVKDREVPGVREFEPDGTEMSTQFDAGSESVGAVTLDASSDVFVADSNGGFHVLEYDSAGDELESFGAKTAAGADGMAFSDALGELYVSNLGEDDVWILTPRPGPSVELGSESATPGQRGTATLEASVNPEGNQTTYHFEYVTEAQFHASGYASASNTSSVSAGSTFDNQPVSAHLTGLVPGGTYHYRVVATNSKGTATGPDQMFTTVPPALVEGPWVVDVAGTSATLAAKIDSLGANTEYRLEYGTSTSYGQTVSGNVGEGTSYVLVSSHRQELMPATTYHYRIVTHNEVGTVEGADHTFTTQAAGGELTMLDGRAWELVSPPEKGGALIQPLFGSEIQAATDGSGIAYNANTPLGEGQKAYLYSAQILSRRGPSGWTSEDINMQQVSPEFGFNEDGNEYRLFSSDLSSALIQSQLDTMPQSPEATESSDYLRNDLNGSYVPLVRTGNIPPGTKFGLMPEQGGGELNSGEQVSVIAGTPDLSHVILRSPLALTGEAINEVGVKNNEGRSLYEWSGGQLQLVNILPNGEPTVGGSLGSEEGVEEGGMLTHAISSDGRWIVWHMGHAANGTAALYVRDMPEKRTVRVGRDHALFQFMSSDGSNVFFLEGGELYEFDTGTDTQTDITADHGAGESNAGVQDAVLGASEDGSYVYFVSRGILANANGAVGGGDNLYVAHDNGGEWSTSYVTTLSNEDEHSWSSQSLSAELELKGVSSRVSPNGHYITFMSDRSLTGYDNVDAVSGEPDEEVYLYDALTSRLVCASCDPTGARPVGLFIRTEAPEPLVASQTEWPGRWLAGSVPGWRQVFFRELYQPRYLSDSGRLFFESPDGLVPQATNGLENVYEYEPSGVGGVGGCTEESPTFGERSGGCVNLISSGTSSSESEFMDASENGDDAFFITTSKLSAADYDDAYDVYDAHVCSVEVPCVIAPVSSPACTSGDSCKAAPTPQPEVFGPAPSATFSGVGNVIPSTSVMVKSKSLTNARRLARALSVCHTKRNKVKRAACERQSRKRYPAKKARKATVNASKKDDR